MTSSLAVFLICDMGKISVFDKIVIENKIDRKYENQINFYIYLRLHDLGMEFTAC